MQMAVTAATVTAAIQALVASGIWQPVREKVMEVLSLEVLFLRFLEDVSPPAGQEGLL